MSFYKLFLVLITAVFTIVGVSALARSEPTGGFMVVAASPAPRSLGAATHAIITVTFDRPVNPSTVTGETFHAFGRWSGPVAGAIGFTNLDQTIILTPTNLLSAGEMVMVVLAEEILAADNSVLVGGYSFQFWAETAVSTLDFHTLDTLSTRTTPGNTTRAYGGVATDMNNDGWLDLSIVNEVTADVRVFLNRADGSGLYHPFIQPPAPVNTQASPSEPSDFNMDGNPDLAVVNIATSSVSILLGNGDGTFAPQQQVTVASQPRGIAVLDADADGDMDIVNTNSSGSGSLSLLKNDGNGVFGAPTFFEGGGTNEWALGAADMNEDGRLDLVVSARIGTTPSVIIHASNGDGTFTQIGSQNAGGTPWMLNTGDVNGDGHEDVAVVNSGSNNGAILLGNGDGTLAAPVTYATDSFPLATDLGDIDGDGDLDWATSSFSGDWFLFLNDGQGNFSFYQEFPAAEAASCALMLDFDNDNFLDLALIDELADTVMLVNNRPPTPAIQVSPPVLASTQPTNTLVTLNMLIQNTGTADLTWELHENSCAAPQDTPWLTSTPVSGTLPLATTQVISVTFDSVGLPAMVYTTTLCVESNDPSTPEWTVPVTLTVEQPVEPAPTIFVSPAAITSTQTADSVVTHTLTISNSGTADLTWTIQETGCAPGDVSWLAFLPTDGNTASNNQDEVVVVLNTASLSVGTYQATACINSNDLAIPQWLLPIEVTVQETAVSYTIYLPVISED